MTWMQFDAWCLYCNHKRKSRGDDDRSEITDWTKNRTIAKKINLKNVKDETKRANFIFWCLLFHAHHWFQHKFHWYAEKWKRAGRERERDKWVDEHTIKSGCLPTTNCQLKYFNFRYFIIWLRAESYTCQFSPFLWSSFQHIYHASPSVHIQMITRFFVLVCLLYFRHFVAEMETGF